MKITCHIRLLKTVKKRLKSNDITFKLDVLDETHAREIIKAKIKEKHTIINLIPEKDGK